MSIQHALLTSLLEKPSSGYELANRFDHSIGYFWQATHQQIYRELARMADAGWLLAEHDATGTSRRKKTYHVLEAGRRELARWIAEPGDPGRSDQALLIKLRAEAVLGPLGASQELHRLIALHKTRLQMYRDIEQRDFPAADMDHAQKLRHAVLRMGIKTEENWLAWAKETLPLME
ncbi:DNA-binding transcriptional regulator, PadR family [Halopseudomonas litoralis]|uniref:DNA-binding transcriptional regulator, PadR family n=1 Tax=Halopseudomonas litoralis TaxID=797277 RepID=A0A1H1UIC4_9GAMM|nr:PadR family transcriptional regulator [Halopseudomonas litoralis]SDS72203.1 DNA-binding transcriptional regulator, PadR family [Halopseudomonas litoralis]